MRLESDTVVLKISKILTRGSEVLRFRGEVFTALWQFLTIFSSEMVVLGRGNFECLNSFVLNGTSKFAPKQA